MRKTFIILTILVACVFTHACIPANPRSHGSEEMEEYTRHWKKYNALAMDDSILIYTRPILQKSLENGDTLTALYCGVYMAQAWLFLEETDSTLKCLIDMERDLDKFDDNLLKYLYYCVYGGYSLKADLNYSKAMEYYQKSYEYAVGTGKASNQLRILLDIIYIFYMRSDPQGMEYAEDAYRLAQAEGISVEHKCTANMAMAMMLHIKGEDEKALRYLRTAQDYAEKGQVITLYSLVYKVFADIYTAAKDYGQAKYYYKKALEYSGYADAGTETMVCLDYGRMLYVTGCYTDAEKILEYGLEVSYRHSNHECRKELLSSLIDVELALGDDGQVISYLGNYRLYLDSVSNIQREKEFNSVLMSIQRMKYEN